MTGTRTIETIASITVASVAGGTLGFLFAWFACPCSIVFVGVVGDALSVMLGVSVVEIVGVLVFSAGVGVGVSVGVVVWLGVGAGVGVGSILCAGVKVGSIVGEEVILGSCCTISVAGGLEAAR